MALESPIKLKIPRSKHVAPNKFSVTTISDFPSYFPEFSAIISPRASVHFAASASRASANSPQSAFASRLISVI
jgi:hypothetical protein